MLRAPPLLLLTVIIIIITVIAHVNHESIQGIIHTALLFGYLDLLGKSASVLFYAFFCDYRLQPCGLMRLRPVGKLNIMLESDALC